MFLFLFNFNFIYFILIQFSYKILAKNTYYVLRVKQENYILRIIAVFKYIIPKVYFQNPSYIFIQF